MQDQTPFQKRAAAWILETFGPEIAGNLIERSQRFLEEALELVQCAGLTPEQAYRLVDHVYGRPVGETRQEIGGVMVTLSGLVTALGEDMTEAGEIELTRILPLGEKLRAKRALKPANIKI